MQFEMLGEAHDLLPMSWDWLEVAGSENADIVRKRSKGFGLEGIAGKEWDLRGDDRGQKRVEATHGKWQRSR